MANKRMFTMKIVDSDAFLDMPLSTQCLYFHLTMRADDDGFIGNLKRIMKIVGASDDDLKLLIAKSFLLVFENGVIVIKHWRMHNTLSKRRYHETQYTDEKGGLLLKKNGSYSLTTGDPIDDSRLVEMFDSSGEQTENADLGLDLDLDKDIVISVSKDTVCQTDIRQIMEKWNELQSIGIKPIVRLSKSSKRYGNLIARIKEYGQENILIAIEKIKSSDYCQGKNKYGWTITFDWFVLPSNFPKVLEGNYDNRKVEGNNGKSSGATKKYNDRIFGEGTFNESNETLF